MGDAEFGFEGGDEPRVVQLVLGVGLAEDDEGGGHVVLEEAGDGLVGVVWGALNEVSNVAVACVILEDVPRPWEGEPVLNVSMSLLVTGSMLTSMSWTTVATMGSRYLLNAWNFGLSVLWWFQLFIQGGDGRREINRGGRVRDA